MTLHGQENIYLNKRTKKVIHVPFFFFFKFSKTVAIYKSRLDRHFPDRHLQGYSQSCSLWSASSTLHHVIVNKHEADFSRRSLF